jgi:heme-degrading monooxygenase HmoA
MAEEPKIARVWKGSVRPAVADEYEAYNHAAGILPLAEKALGVQCFREDLADEVVFTTISWWPSLEAMTAFAGDDPTAVHHLPKDEEYLIELPERVEILTLRHTHGRPG